MDLRGINRLANNYTRAKNEYDRLSELLHVLDIRRHQVSRNIGRHLGLSYYTALSRQGIPHASVRTHPSYRKAHNKYREVLHRRYNLFHERVRPLEMEIAQKFPGNYAPISTLVRRWKWASEFLKTKNLPANMKRTIIETAMRSRSL